MSIFTRETKAKLQVNHNPKSKIIIKMKEIPSLEIRC